MSAPSDHGPAHDRARLDNAIIVDEIGLESGGYGIYRLRCLYQPVFARRGQALQALAVEGFARPFVAGDEVPEDLFLGAAAEDDLDFIRQMGLVLPLRNHRNLEADDVDLFLSLAPAGQSFAHVLDRLALVAEEIAAIELDPACVVCAVSDIAGAADLAQLAQKIRGHGMRVAIGDFGAGRWTDEQLDLLSPDVVRIDGDWFRQVCRDAVTVRLFDSVVARLSERGARVLVDGIDREQQLGVALRGGADLLQGPHLAPPAHVGTGLAETLSLKAKLGATAKIVSLYG